MTPLWRRAPAALIHYPTVLVAVLVAAALGSLAAASSTFVTNATASAALKTELVDLSAYTSGLQVTTNTWEGAAPPTAAFEARQATAFEQIAASLGLQPPVRTIVTDTVYVESPQGDLPVRLMSRTGAVQHVKIVDRGPGAGVWVDDVAAKLAHLKPGSTLRLAVLSQFGARRVVHLRVKGIYHALAHGPETPYWSNFAQQIYPASLDAGDPPRFLFLPTAQLDRIVQLAAKPPRGARRIGLSNPFAVTREAEMPVDPSGLTLAAAKRLAARFQDLSKTLPLSATGRALRCVRGETGSASGSVNGVPTPGAKASCAVESSLEQAVTIAQRNADAVSSSVTLLAGIGTAIALAVAVAAGAFLVRRRRAESALHFARGETVISFGGRTAIEAFLPSVAGAAIGLVVAYALSGVFAPGGSLDSAALNSAALRVTAATVVGIGVLVAAAAVAYTHLYDTRGTSRHWIAKLPWEVLLLVGALLLYLQVRSGGGLAASGTSQTQHPTLAVFAFPLLLVAGVAGLAARGARRLLGAASSWAARRPPGVYLAVRRLAAARGLLVLLAVVSAVAFGAFFYAETLATSLRHTMVEKAYISTGSDVSGTIIDEPLPKRFPYPITSVTVGNQAASIGTSYGAPADVMTVDPATLAPVLHWQSAWGTNPTSYVAQLGKLPSLPLPVIVTPELAGRKAIFIGGSRFPIHIAGVVKAFPGMSVGVPLVVTPKRALTEAAARLHIDDPLNVATTYVWVKGPPTAARKALVNSSVQPYYVGTVDTFLKDPNVLLATRTFSFMRVIALSAGLLMLVALLLYLQARRRTQVIASELARRMGARSNIETIALSVEIGAILAFSAIIGGIVAVAAARPIALRIDPVPDNPPSPVFVIPAIEILLAACVLAVLAVAAGVITSRLGQRSDVSEALRGA